MWWSPGPHLKRRMLRESGRGDPSKPRESCSFFQADTDKEELLQVLRQKFGSVTRAWRVALDDDESGTLDFREFTTALRDLGHQGNLRTLWFNLDDDNSGNISLRELDENAAHALEKFRYRCTTKLGTIQDAWHKCLDKDRSGFISRFEFVDGAKELGYETEEEIFNLFSLLLVKPGSSTITLGDITFLQKWEETKVEAMYRKRLATGWVNKDPFIFGDAAWSAPKAGKSLAHDLSAGSLSLPGGVAPSHETEDYGNMCAIDEEQQKEAFRKFLVQRYGSLAKGFDVMDANNSGSLSMVEFQSVVSTVLRYCRPTDARRLFLAFNTDPGAMLTWDELGISSPEWINYMLDRRTQKRQQAAVTGSNRFHQLGASPRQSQAQDQHRSRLGDPKPTRNIAFGMPLPKGWGMTGTSGAMTAR